MTDLMSQPDRAAFEQAMRQLAAAFEAPMRRAAGEIAESARYLSALMTPGLIAAGRACRELEAALDTQWPEWREFAANVPDWVPEPPYQGCHCFCQVAHGGLGVCVGEAEPDLFVVGSLDGQRIDIPVCRECLEARASATS